MHTGYQEGEHGQQIGLGKAGDDAVAVCASANTILVVIVTGPPQAAMAPMDAVYAAIKGAGQ